MYGRRFTLTLILCLVGITANIQASTERKINKAKEALVLRQIGELCGDSEEYECLCYTDDEKAVERINQYIMHHRKDIKSITIENPSQVIDELNFKRLKQLEEFIIFGNDYDTDGLYTLPKQLLKLPNLKIIEFDGVRFPSKELNKIKRKYPNLIIKGNVSEL
ncbi:MAG: hypothetical protein R2753_00885 [Chitinophagales bacterium]